MQAAERPNGTKGTGRAGSETGDPETLEHEPAAPGIQRSVRAGRTEGLATASNPQGLFWPRKTRPRRFHGHNKGIHTMSANQYPVMNQYPVNLRFGLLPEGEGRGASFLTSVIINLIILA